MKSLKERFENLILSSDEVNYLKGELDGNIPELTLDGFNEYFKSGNRLEYENKYFKKRRRLAVLTMLAKYDSGYLPELCDLIKSVCAEFSWALPAHIADMSSARTEVDLFAAETAQTLAEIKYLLPLPEDVRCLITDSVNERVITPYMSREFGWEKAWNNWAAVCGGCVGMTLIYEAPELFEKSGNRLINTMKSYLSGFRDDGACGEGLAYWTYGFGYFMYFVRAYEEYSGESGTVLNIQKIRNIAEFNVYLTENCVASFSDCVRNFSYQPSLLGLLREYFGDGIVIPDTRYASRFDDCGRFAHFIRSFVYTSAADSENARDFVFYPQTQWYINRRGKFAFAAKGGSNGESHNHNDIGAFIIAADGKQYITDFGAGEYTRDYFSDKRYENIVCSSFGHSVPIIDGKGQSAGNEFRASDVSDDENGFSLDIAGAYDVKGLKSLKRKFLVDDNGITLTDTCEFDGGKHRITERFTSLIKPEITENGVKTGRITLLCGASPDVSSATVKNHEGYDEIIYFIDYQAETEFKLRIE